MAGSKPKSKRKKPVRKKIVKQNNPVVSEIIILFTIAFCVFLIFSVFTTNGAGFAGAAIKSFFTGAFGFGAY